MTRHHLVLTSMDSRSAAHRHLANSARSNMQVYPYLIIAAQAPIFVMGLCIVFRPHIKAILKSWGCQHTVL